MLVMVTEPVAPVLNDTGVVDMPSVVGVTGAVTVTGTVVASVLLPPKLMAVGPSAAAAVRVMPQLAKEASAAPHVFDCTVIPLPAGAVAVTLKAAEAPVLLMRTVVEPPAANDSGALGIESVAVGTGTVTVTCTVVVGVLLPPKMTAVGPSAAAAVSVIVQSAPGAREMGQVLDATVMSLPTGMVACTLNAGAGPLLVMVTVPAPLVPNDTGAAGMSSVVGVTGTVTVTGTVVAGVLVPPKLIAVGPSAAAAVSVIVQLAAGARMAGQVVVDTVMPLPAGMVACTLNAGALPLLVMVTEPAPPVPNDRGVVGMFSVVGTTGAVTVIGTVVAGVLLPPKPMLVGPSAAAAVSVIVQLAAGARMAAQVVLDTVMPLPAGMVACTLNAGALPLLLMVTEPAPPVPKDTGAVGMFSVVGVTGVVTVTGTVVAGVLLPPTPMLVGPSGPAAVSVMVQLAPTGSDAGQVEEATVMPLPTGMMARRLNAGAVPLLVMVTEPAP